MAYQTVNPYTNELVKSYPYPSEAEIDAAMVKSDIPFGGVKNSGDGNELTEFGIREFVSNKVVDIFVIDAPFQPRQAVAIRSSRVSPAGNVDCSPVNDNYSTNRRKE